MSALNLDYSTIKDGSLGKEKSMLSENQKKAFADFRNSPQMEEILGAKTAHMIKIAAAMAFGCYP